MSTIEEKTEQALARIFAHCDAVANAPFAWIIRLHNGEWSMGMNKRCVRSILQAA
jgi:hypothetical protein